MLHHKKKKKFTLSFSFPSKPKIKIMHLHLSATKKPQIFCSMSLFQTCRAKRWHLEKRVMEETERGEKHNAFCDVISVLWGHVGHVMFLKASRDRLHHRFRCFLGFLCCSRIKILCYPIFNKQNIVLSCPVGGAR